MSVQPVQSAEPVGARFRRRRNPLDDRVQPVESVEPAGAPATEPAVPTAGRPRRAYAGFVVDPDTSRVEARIIDPATQRVIRAIPPADVEQLARSLREYADAAPGAVVGASRWGAPLAQSLREHADAAARRRSAARAACPEL
jgi:hypothetical protein